MAFFRGAEFDTDRYLLVAIIRKILAVIQQATQKWMWKDLISGRLRELEDSKQYQIKISNRSAALGIFCENEDINRD
jgi:hypothetical protein